MIMITLADGNPTYCQGLKTMLEQVEDFRVAVIPPENFRPGIVNDPPAGILLVDDDLYQLYRKQYGEKEITPPSPKTIILTMDRDELFYPHHGQEVLYKGSGKREFEERIRKLAHADVNSTNI